MATINQFYRFEDAQEISSMGQGAKAISNATYLLYNDLILVYTGQTIGQVINTIKPFVEQYNADYQASFVVEKVNFPAYYSVPYNAQIYVYDTNLVTTYPLHKISLVFEIDGSGLVINNAVNFFGTINENYNYAPALYSGERLAYDALLERYNTGTSIFPVYYKYDPVTEEAISSIARFKNCQLNTTTKQPERVTPDTNARGNRPIIKLGELGADAKYIIGLFDGLIKQSQSPTATWSTLLSAFQALIAPSGYGVQIFTDLSANNRIQATVFKTGGQALSLIMREDNGFLFQRFIALQWSSHNILADYADNITLPYEPTSYDKKYGSVFYDFEFCEFSNCLFPEKEIYRMPIKTGDKYQFNILPSVANVLTEGTADIGIFDKNYNLVQKIGSFTIPEQDCSCSYSWTIQYTEQQFSDAVIYEINQNLNGFYSWIFGVYFNGTLEYSAEEPLPSDFLDNAQQGVDYLLSLSNNEITITGGVNQDNSVTLTVTIAYLGECIAPVLSVGVFVTEQGVCLTNCEPYPYPFATLNTAQCCTTATQWQGSVLIPPLQDGCYRFGLYKFNLNYEGLTVTYTDQDFIVNAGSNYVLALVNENMVSGYFIAIPNAIASYYDLYLWLVDNVSFANVTLDQNGYLTITVCPYGQLINYTVQIGTINYQTGILTPVNADSTDTTLCGEQSYPINEIYAFSNLLELDNSDCFSSILQFWAESNSIAEGNEYFADWYQQVRLGINGGGKKPVLTESVYRQSNGVFKRPQNKQDYSIDLHTDFLDYETQAALVDATRHPSFVVDGQNLFVNGEIEVATVQDFTTQSSFEDLAQVKFSALIQGYQPKNSTCINC